MSKELLSAIFDDDIDKFRLLIGNGADINYVDPETSDSALHLAIKSGNDEFVTEVLSNSKLDPNIKDDKGNTVLLILVRYLDTELTLIRTLLDKGADPRLKNNKGINSLQIAMSNESHLVVDLILRHKNIPKWIEENPDFLNNKDSSGKTVLQLALEQQQSELMNLLLKNDADVYATDKNGNSLLHVAVASYDPDIFEEIFAYYRNTEDVNNKNKFGQTPLHLAIENTTSIKSDIVRKLLKLPQIDLSTKNRRGHNAIDHMAYMGDIDSLKQAQKLKIVDLSNTETAERLCSIAAKQGRISFLKYLAKFNQDAVEKNPLANQFLSKDSDYQEYMEQIFSEFNTDFGNIDHEGGLISLAELREASQSKGKPFNGYVIKGHYVLEFLKAIKERADLKLADKIKIEFVLTGAHWRTVYIEIDQEHTSICLFDSLGIKQDERISLCDDMISVIPDAEIYLATDRRQYSKSGCSVCALSDVDDLTKIDDYIGSKYKSLGFFEYLKDHQIKTAEFQFRDSQTGEKERAYTVHYVSYPLVLLRNKQSMQTKGEGSTTPYWIESRPEERNIKTRKRQDTLEESALRFVEILNDKPMNLRLEHKLNRLLDKSVVFLLSKNSRDQVTEAVKIVSVDGFKAETAALLDELQVGKHLSS